MPLTFTIDHERNLADVRGSGKGTLEDTIRVVRGVAAEIAPEQCGCLVDIRALDFFPTIAELKEIAFEFIRLRAAFRCGTSFIVGNDRHYALGRFLALLVDTAGIRMAVFKDPGQAEQWLMTHTGAHRARIAAAQEKSGGRESGKTAGQPPRSSDRPGLGPACSYRVPRSQRTSRFMKPLGGGMYWSSSASVVIQRLLAITL
jgi:hypothetical protein